MPITTRMSKLEKLIALQQEKNERDAELKRRTLRLRNAMLYPGRKKSQSFVSATASSQAKKKRPVPVVGWCEEEPTPKKQPKIEFSPTKPIPFHFHSKTRKRAKSQSYHRSPKKSPSKPKIHRGPKEERLKITVPVAFNFATSSRIKKTPVIESPVQTKTKIRRGPSKKPKRNSKARSKSKSKTSKQKQLSAFAQHRYNFNVAKDAQKRTPKPFTGTKATILSSRSTISSSNKSLRRNQSAKDVKNASVLDEQSNKSVYGQNQSKSKRTRPMSRSRSVPHFMKTTKNQNSRTVKIAQEKRAKYEVVKAKDAKRLIQRSPKRRKSKRSIKNVQSTIKAHRLLRHQKSPAKKTTSRMKKPKTPKKPKSTRSTRERRFNKELSAIKEKLRTGDVIDSTKSKVQSVYSRSRINHAAKTKTTAKSTSNSKSNSAQKRVQNIQKNRKSCIDESKLKELNPLTPIKELRFHDLDDLAIDEILMEDATKISDCGASALNTAEFSSTENLMHVDICEDPEIIKQIDPKCTFSPLNKHNLSEILSPVTIVSHTDSRENDLSLVVDGDDPMGDNNLVISLKEKFTKLDSLFIEISERMDCLEDASSSFEF